MASQSNLTPTEKIIKAYEVKDEGNGHFKALDYQTAIKRYHHALLYVKGLSDENPFQALTGVSPLSNGENKLSEKSKESIKELEFICNNNLAGKV